jgi:hypothetical protein
MCTSALYLNNYRFLLFLGISVLDPESRNRRSGYNPIREFYRRTFRLGKILGASAGMRRSHCVGLFLSI